jgi:O-antigen ligase/tetratricopeptide (TPR) repeat protein
MEGTPPNSAAGSSSLLTTAGQALLVIHLVLSATLFSTTTTEVFEFNKVALLILAALLLATGAAARRWNGWRNAMREPVGVCVALFLASSVLSTVFSCSPLTSLRGAQESFAGLGTVAGYAVLFFATRALCRSADGAHRLLMAPVVGGVFAAGYAALQVARLDPIRWSSVSPLAGYVRPFGTLGHPNQFAIYLVMVLPLVACFAALAWRRRQWLAVAVLVLAVGLMTFGIVAAVSRGAWLALAIAVTVAALPWLRRRLIVGTGIGLLLVGALAAWGVLGSTGQGMVNSVLERTRHFGDASSRMHIWRGALGIWQEHPLFGCGLDTFGFAFQSQRTPAYWAVEWNGTPTRAHNEALHVLATQGLLGAAAALALLFAVGWAARRAWRGVSPANRPLVSAMIAGLVGLFVEDLFSFTTVGCGTLLVTFAAILSRLGTEGEGSEESSWPRWPLPAASVLACALFLFEDVEMAAGLATPVLLGLVALGFGLAVATGSLLRLFSWNSLSACRDDGERKTWSLPVQVAIWSAGAAAVFLLVIRPVIADRASQTGDGLLSLDPDGAVAWLEHAVSLAPESDLYWTRLGNARQVQASTPGSDRRACLERGVAAYDRAAALVPVNGYHHSNRGRLLSELAHDGWARPEDAFAALDTALRLDNGNAYFHLFAAHIARNLGDLPRAKEHIRRGLELYPRFGPLRTQEAFVAMLEGRPRDAEAMYPEAPYLDWHGDDRAYLNLLGVMAWGRLQQKCYLDAWFVTNHVLYYLPDWPLARLVLAEALEGAGKIEDAQNEYRRFLTLCPRHPGATAALRRLERASAGRKPARDVAPAGN